MTKQILSLTQDHILETKFIANKKLSGGDCDWVDETKTKANGKIIVDSIYVLISKEDEYGNRSNLIQKVWLSKKDILDLAKKISEIEVEAIGLPDDELPF